MTDTTDVPATHLPARYFLEHGFRMGLNAAGRPDAFLNRAIPDSIWSSAADVSPDRAEFDRQLHRADSADQQLRDGEAAYRAHFAADRDTTGSREELATCAENLRRFGAELFPTNRNGQAHFARVIMDTVANSIDARLARKSSTGPFIVWSPDGGTAPAVQHKSHGSAHRAAHLLAKQHPGRTFIVMEKSGKRICVEPSA